MTRPGWLAAGSLRVRLLGVTLLALVAALVIAGVMLSGLFRDQVTRQFEATLAEQLDLLTAGLTFDAAGQPQIDGRMGGDPRWERPYSGLYWQIDRVGADARTRDLALRSRSLWDAQLSLALDALADGERHVHTGLGPQGQTLLIVERTVRVSHAAQTAGDATRGATPDAGSGAGSGPAPGWRLMVGGDLAQTVQSMQSFNRSLAVSLGLLGILLAVAAVAQVAVGLSPLRSLQRDLSAVREGRQSRLQGQFAQELQPLVEAFNSVLERNADMTQRARTQAGNLAHALKTPLAVMAQAARSPGSCSELAVLVAEQVSSAQRQLDFHLARARAAATQGLPGQRTPVLPVLQGLLRVMGKVHAARALRWTLQPASSGGAFAGETQDLQDMLGNVLDNAARWARTEVRVTVDQQAARLLICIEDDGPGIAPERRLTALARGGRLDESVPGSGLGLAIVGELVAQYAGAVELENSELGGLRVSLQLPAVPAVPAMPAIASGDQG